MTILEELRAQTNSQQNRWLNERNEKETMKHVLTIKRS